jgi:pimeloyl-ACP methyl ester carboxylesterase
MPMTIFHGEQDRNIPLALVQRAVRDLPSAQLVTFLDEAHISTLSNRFAEIAGAIVCEWNPVK